MGQWVSQGKTLLSIFPLAMRAERPYGKGWVTNGKGEKVFDGYSIFEMPAVPKGKTATIVVSDCWQAEYNIQEPGTPVNTRPVTCEEIVADLLRNWAGSMIMTNAEFGPGIIAIAGDTPTKEELDAVNRRQAGFFETLFYEAEKFFTQKKMDSITSLHREAAKWLNKDREWVHNLRAETDGPCPFCTTVIPAAAYVCPNCQNTVKALPPALLALQNQGAAQGAAKQAAAQSK